MTPTSLIPKQGELVKWHGKEFRVISVNLGGKCKIKKTLLPHKNKVYTDVDISELTRVLTN
jgi:hypothetical protein